MLFLAMVLRGMGIATGPPIVHTYLGEMGKQMDEIRKRQQKKTRKFLLYIAYSLTLNGGTVIAFSEGLQNCT